MSDTQTTKQPHHHHLKTVIRRARLVLLWERMWPTVFAFVLIAMAFLALSWMGVWAAIPAAGRALAIVGFAGLIGFVGWRALQISLPSDADAIDRIEGISGVSHRPLTATLDQPVTKNAAPSASETALWAAHQRRISEALSRLKSGWPRPQIERRDPYALRAVVVLLAFIGFNMAGPDRIARLGDIFNFSTPSEPVIARLDAWVTPPRYTGKAPIFLTKESFTTEDGAIDVPEGSVATIRITNNTQSVVTFEADGSAPVVLSPDGANDEGATSGAGDQTGSQTAQVHYEFPLTESGSLSVNTGTVSRDWAFGVVADQAPTVSFATNPEVQRSGAIQVFAVLKDDYGVVRARGDIEATPAQKAKTKSEGARPLYDAPEFPLSLNRGRVKDGTSKTIRSLVDHPWAGAEIALTLVAVDEAAQEGRSDPYIMTLPQRRFSNPVSRALVEERRNLAMDANYAERLADILDVLTLRPEQFEDDYGVLIALAAVRRGVLDARDDDALRKIVDDLWDIAIGLEDGNLSDAERNLRDALEALREGIQNGASEEELARLMEDARQAMREFMQALAEQAQNNPQSAENDQQQPLDPSQTLNPQDLERMLDQIEDLAQTGSRDAAEQLLSELQQMMENLQASRGQQQQQGESQAQQMLDELGEMIRRQQQLMDETFQQQNNQNRQGQQGQQPGERQGQQQGQRQGQQPGGQQPGQGQQGQDLAEMLRQLQEGQQGLADRLQRFMEQMQQNGMNPNQQLGDAQGSMGDAARELGQGNAPGANRDQADALSQLRQGAQNLANQMAGEGQGEGDHDLAQGDRRTDPLGRQERTRGSDFGDNVKVPDEIDTQRAREIFDAIRRRLGEPLRPRIELDYLERLLRTE